MVDDFVEDLVPLVLCDVVVDVVKKVVVDLKRHIDYSFGMDGWYIIL